MTPDLEPDFEVPFGPTESTFPGKRPTPRPVASATLIPSGGTNKPVFVPDLEPDFSVGFGPSQSGFPQNRPVTTLRPVVTSSAGFPRPEAEPDFALQFPPPETSFFPQGPSEPSNLRPGSPAATFQTDQEPDFSVPFGPVDPELVSERPVQFPGPTDVFPVFTVTPSPGFIASPGLFQHN